MNRSSHIEASKVGRYFQALGRSFSGIPRKLKSTDHYLDSLGPNRLIQACLGICLVVIAITPFFESYVFISLKSAGLMIPYLALLIGKFAIVGCLFFLLILSHPWKLSAPPMVFLFVVGILLYSFQGWLNPLVVKSNIALNIKNNYFWLVIFGLTAFSARKIPVSYLLLIFYSAIILGIANVAYSVMLNLTYSGSPRDFYFYDLYRNMGMWGEANIFRNGSIRSFGFVGSGLGLSQVLLVPMSFLIAYAIHRRSIFAIAILLVCFYGEWLTRTRNPSIAIVVSTLLLLLFRRTKNLIWSVFLVFIYLVGSYWYLFHSYIEDSHNLDLSALGRGQQILWIWEGLNSHPFGSGIGYAGVANPLYAVWTDLSFGTMLLEIGLIPVAIIIFGCFRLVNKVSFSAGNGSPLEQIFASVFFLLMFSLVILSEYSNIFDPSLYSFAIILGSIYNYLQNRQTQFEVR